MPRIETMGTSALPTRPEKPVMRIRRIMVLRSQASRSDHPGAELEG